MERGHKAEKQDPNAADRLRRAKTRVPNSVGHWVVWAFECLRQPAVPVPGAVVADSLTAQHFRTVLVLIYLPIKAQTAPSVLVASVL